MNLGQTKPILEDGKLYNFNGRAFLLLPCTSAVYVLSSDFKDISVDKIQRQIEILSQCGYLCNCRTNPETELQGLVLNVSHTCNLVCDYCSVGQGQYNKDSFTHMNIEIAKRAVDYLTKTSASNEVVIRFFGGEPLLNFAAIRKTVDYCENNYPNRNFHFEVTTNGTLINDEIADFFRRYNFNVCVSLDGNKNDHDKHRKDRYGNGSWDSAVQGTAKLEKVGIKYDINCTLCEDSCFSPEEQEKSLKLRFPHAQIAVGKDGKQLSKSSELKNFFDSSLEKACNKAEQEYSPLFQIISAILTGSNRHVAWCRFGLNFLVVDPRGNLYLCADSIMYDNNENKFCYGNILGTNRDYNFSESLPLKCRTCWAFNLCGKGCHLRTAMGIEPEQSFCKLQFNLIEKALEYISTKSSTFLWNKFVPQLSENIRFKYNIILKSCPDIKPLFLVPCRSEGHRF
ncbi:MAG: radical SAM protein [Planctomycetes bacterium]|nr:radical SAM protein [Planctomycetota bacterium]